VLGTIENHLGPSLDYMLDAGDLRERYAQAVFTFWKTFVNYSSHAEKSVDL
jgi:hypothetical protein